MHKILITCLSIFVAVGLDGTLNPGEPYPYFEVVQLLGSDNMDPANPYSNWSTKIPNYQEFPDGFPFPRGESGNPVLNASLEQLRFAEGYCKAGGEYFDDCGVGFVREWGKCVACPPGSAYDKKEKQCKLCPPGQAQPQSGQTQCDTCKDGYRGTDSSGLVQKQDLWRPDLHVAHVILRNCLCHKIELKRWS